MDFTVIKDIVLNREKVSSHFQHRVSAQRARAEAQETYL
jgi:hypothetical protein